MSLFKKSPTKNLETKLALATGMLRATQSLLKNLLILTSHATTEAQSSNINYMIGEILRELKEVIETLEKTE